MRGSLLESRWRRLSRRTAAALLVAVTLAAAAPAVLAAPHTEVPVGVLLSDPDVSEPSAVFRGLELAARQLTAAGLAVRLIAEDPAPDAAAAALRLIAGGAVAIVGAGTSSDTISAAEAHAIPRSVVMISPAATAPALTDLAADRGRDFLSGPAHAAFVRHYRAAYGDKPPLPFIENAYDALAVIGLAAFRALAAGQPVTGSSVRDHLRAVAGPPGEVVGPGDFARAFALLSADREIDYQGASGSVDFDAAGDVATSIEVWRFAAGGIEPLFTRDARQPSCDYTPAATATPYVPGLIVGADVLSPEGHRPDYGVHIRFTGGIGAVAEFETLRAAYPDSAVLDCRGRAVVSPGFVNAHEHPAYSWAFPDANLNPGYVHRDEWRLGLNGKVALPTPPRYDYDPDDPNAAAVLIAMELRHLVGGATAIAGSGGVPGVIRNVNRQRRPGDLALYDAEAVMATFPFSFRVVEDLADECRGGPAYRFEPREDPNLAFMAYVPHVGEGRLESCAAQAEVARYLQRVQQRDRRYSLIHGVATDREDYAVMREFDVTLVWSPRSNLALYGQTVDIAGALEEGVRVALSTDWSPSGSFTMREEVTCARRVAQEAGVALSSELLWRMATGNGAYALGLEDRFGAIEPGLSADLILVKHTGGDPYEAVLTATDEDVLATWIDGRPILLSGSLNEALSASECVALDGVAPRVCGVLGAFGLSPERFDRSIQDVVPVNDVSGQASCIPEMAATRPPG